MITTTINVVGMADGKPIALGRQGESNYREFVFDCSGFGVTVTGVTLVHKRQKDKIPYCVIGSDTDTVTWVVTDTDTMYDGYGEGEIRITFEDGVVKSAVFNTVVIKSMTSMTEMPGEYRAWYDAMIDYINEMTSDTVISEAVQAWIDEHPIGVESVNNMTGQVVLTASDVGALPDTTVIPTVPSNVSAFINDAGYITGYIETDPVFSASAASAITASDVATWNGQYTKPSGGIPVSDLNSTARSRLIPTGGTTGQVLSKVSGSNYDVEWTTVSGGGAVDSVNGQTGTVVLDADDVGALPDTYTAPVTSVNTKTGAVTLTASDVGALSSSTTFVSSFNGNTGAVTYTAPVTSVNGQTGAVTVTVPTQTSDLINDSGYITSAPVDSVDGKTGTVTVIPTGGSTGQVLAKASNTDRDVEWTTPASGGGETWRVIRELTTTEAVTSITIDKDTDGNSFALSQFKMFIVIPASAQASNLQFGVNTYWFDQIGGLNTSSGRHGSYTMGLNPDNTAWRMYEKLGIGTENTAYYSVQEQQWYNGGIVTPSHTYPSGFTSIKFRQSNTSYALPTGTHIWIYGVDKS